jgi:hypothetical protein
VLHKQTGAAVENGEKMVHGWYIQHRQETLHADVDDSCLRSIQERKENGAINLRSYVQQNTEGLYTGYGTHSNCYSRKQVKICYWLFHLYFLMLILTLLLQI